MNINHASPIFASDVSSHFADGIIPININKDIKINLRIEDIEFLSQHSLDIDVDFNKWKKAVFNFKTSIIQKEMKGAILSSLQVVDIFFYDSEYQSFSIEKKAIEQNIETILENWQQRLATKLKVIEKRFEECYQKSDKQIALSTDKDTLEFSNILYNIEIKNKNIFFETLEQYINEYIDNSITFLTKREPLGFELSLEDFKIRFNQLLQIKEPTSSDILSFLEWTCSLLKIEVENY